VLESLAFCCRLQMVFCLCVILFTYYFLVGIIRDAHYFWMLVSAKLFNGGNNVPFEQLGNLIVFTFFFCVPGAFFIVGVLCSMILT